MNWDAIGAIGELLGARTFLILMYALDSMNPGTIGSVTGLAKVAEKVLE